MPKSIGFWLKYNQIVPSKGVIERSTVYTPSSSILCFCCSSSAPAALQGFFDNPTGRRCSYCKALFIKMAEWEQEIDESKDYYKVLGVAPGVTNEELKAAYVQLALTHHPDTAISGDGEHFIKISEAWSILSKPEVRSRYDAIRGRYLGLGSSFGSSGSTESVHSSIPIGFNTQKANFGRVQHHAGATMEDTQIKMRTERWHSMPLSEKKAFRTKPISSFSASVLTMVVPVLVMGGIVIASYSAYNSKQAKKN